MPPLSAPGGGLGMRQPPVTPPEVPTLASYPTAGGPPPGGAETVQKLVFTLEQGVESLAQMVPGASDIADQAKSLLRQILVAAARGGSAESGNAPPSSAPFGGQVSAPAAPPI